MQSNRDDLQRYIADLEHEKLRLLEQTKETEKSLDMARSELDYEKSRYVELETILSEERRVQHSKDVKLRSLEVEMAEYRSELNRKELRLSSRRGSNDLALQNHLHALQRHASSDNERQQLVTLVRGRG